jgi:Ca-activated chloride channel family protein
VTVGVGTTAGTTVDLDGFLIQTALDEDSLRRIADRTAGSYAPAAELDPAVVYDGLSRHLVARESHVELTAILAAAGLVLLLTAAGLTIGRSGRLP